MERYYHPVPLVWDLKEKPNKWRILFFALLALILGFSLYVLSAEETHIELFGSTYTITKE